MPIREKLLLCYASAVTGLLAVFVAYRTDWILDTARWAVLACSGMVLDKVEMQYLTGAMSGGLRVFFTVWALSALVYSLAIADVIRREQLAKRRYRRSRAEPFTLYPRHRPSPYGAELGRFNARITR